MQSISPKLKLKVANKLKNDGSFSQIELNFNSIDEFNPGKIANKVDSLRELIEIRKN